MSTSGGLFRDNREIIRDFNQQGCDRDGRSRTISKRRIESKPSAMLHLFTPAVKEDPIIRPFQFRIDPIFMEDLTNTILDVKRDASRSATGIARDHFYMNGKESADRALMPSDNSYLFGRKYINNQWQFILEVNNATLRGRHIESHLKNKIIYTGYVIGDEPVTKRGTLNYDAELVFTHLTQLDIGESFNNDSYRANVRPRLDLDILSPSILNMDSSENDDRKYLIAPNQILDVIDDGEDDEDFYNDSVSNPALATLETKRNAVTEISVYNSPRQQFNRIVSGLAKTVLAHDDHDSRLSSDRSATLLRSRYDIRRTFKNFVGGDHLDRAMGPEYRKVITINKLLTLYPDLIDNVQINEIPSAFEYNTLDEGNNDLLSIMSSYLKNAIPPVFADHGLSDVSMRYATSDPTQLFITKRDRDPIIDVIDCQPVLDEPFDDTRRRCRMAIEHLQEYVFAVVERICDDIELYIDFRLGQDTLIQLQLRDHTEEINDEYVIHQGNLGGIISPQLGGVDEFENHNNALTDMINIVDSGISQDRRFI